MPGSMPFMPRIMRAKFPPFIIFIIFCICSNWLRSWFTACTETPAPAAMRRLREALMISGLRRSAGVIALMMPSLRRQLVHERGDAAHLLHLRDLLLEVLQVEALALLHLLGDALRLLEVDLGVRLLDQRQDVAHAEDARRHALGVERLEAVELLGHAGELDRLYGYVDHR